MPNSNEKVHIPSFYSWTNSMLLPPPTPLTHIMHICHWKLSKRNNEQPPVYNCSETSHCVTFHLPFDLPWMYILLVPKALPLTVFKHRGRFQSCNCLCRKLHRGTCVCCVVYLPVRPSVRLSVSVCVFLPSVRPCAFVVQSS